MKTRLTFFQALVASTAIFISGSVADPIPKFNKHVVDLTIAVQKGEVGVHFSKEGEPNSVEHPQRRSQFRLFGSPYFKIWSRDDDNSRIDAPETVHAVFDAYGPGVFIFDVSDWEGDPHLEITLSIDGKLLYHAVGASPKIKEGSRYVWDVNPKEGEYRVTDNREIRFYLH